MARNSRRVKRYYGRMTSSSYRAKPRPLTVILVILLFAGLGYLGTVIYEPVYDFVMSIGKAPTIVASEPEVTPPPQVVSSSTAPEPEPTPEPEFDKLRAVYLPHNIAADPAALESFLQKLEGTQINAVMVDIKNSAGNVLFKSKNELANKWGVIAENAIDLKAFSDKLKSKNLNLVTKMSVFRDPKAASAGRLDYAINYQNSQFLWLDASPENGGKPWLNPYSPKTHDYIDAIAKEAIDAGAKMLVLENVQFPDSSGVYATFGKDATLMSRAEILQTTVSDLTADATAANVRLAVSCSVVDATNDKGADTRYGGSILKIPQEYLLLNTSPSQYDGDYAANGLEITKPLENPAETTEKAITYAKQGVNADTKIIPMLQGGGDLALTDAQIKAVEKLSLQEYFLFNQDGIYTLK